MFSNNAIFNIQGDLYNISVSLCRHENRKQYSKNQKQ